MRLNRSGQESTEPQASGAARRKTAKDHQREL